MKFTYIRTLFIGLSLLLSTTAQAGLIQLNVESAGYSIGYYAHLNVDGVDVIEGQSKRGVNLAVLDQHTGRVLDTTWFDTYGALNASGSLAAYINSITEGRIVLVGVKDEATVNFGNDAKLAIQSLGGSVDNISTIGYRASYALIGIAGAGVGAREAFEKSSAISGVSVSDTLSISVPEPATFAIFGLGLIALVVRKSKKYA